MKATIVNALTEIKFTNLKILRLENCNLTNMEIATLFDVPKLKLLSLQNNFITNFRSLIKCFSVKPV